MRCTQTASWQDCALAVKNAIANAKTPSEAFEAGTEWSKKYDQIFDKSAPSTWPPTDRQRLEDGMAEQFDELIRKYLSPESLALGLAVKKYFPKLSAILEFSLPPFATGLYAFLAPSPLVTDFSQAKSANEEIGYALLKKLQTFLPTDWRSNYTDKVRLVLEDMKKPSIPKP
jgi:hypothetical protein